ncbi:hypothetical protein SNOG_14022 [Parastagonospora nodorum SN15]|uniref:Uncharacterized protein n=1 Tax=Phaeosphaeria nodorum (strain SN15 / ATCC MYA-4574 / FGSC 10173) TaxID=321614 RepID=Q0U2L1_PHANO|nr:hypothetical protein SNOG_14022 [Parastagonospora nodorum SN15]EAT78647.1 hypothetical protein SNOG_14022 [Parastagonospora nodorum SN15]
MLYFLHHPAGPVVIRTTNPYIVLSYQRNAWHTTTSWPEVLEDHPEWSSPSPNILPTSTLCSRIFNAMRTSLAMVPGGGVYGGEADEDEVDEVTSNAGPVHFLTAVTRSRYHELGLATPDEKWITCIEGDEVYDYRLEQGIWELDVVPEYAVEA